MIIIYYIMTNGNMSSIIMPIGNKIWERGVL